MKIERMLLPPIYTRKKLKDQVQREIAAEVVGSVDPDANKNANSEQYSMSNFSESEQQQEHESTPEAKLGNKNSAINIVV